MCILILHVGFTTVFERGKVVSGWSKVNVNTLMNVRCTSGFVHLSEDRISECLGSRTEGTFQCFASGNHKNIEAATLYPPNNS